MKSFENQVVKQSCRRDPARLGDSVDSANTEGSVMSSGKGEVLVQDANNNPDDLDTNCNSSQVGTTQGQPSSNAPTILLDNIDLELTSSGGKFAITLHEIIGRFELFPFS